MGVGRDSGFAGKFFGEGLELSYRWLKILASKRGPQGQEVIWSNPRFPKGYLLYLNSN